MNSSKQKKLTIKDIAHRANVSKGTVSRVINDLPGVGKKTRERIKQLIKKLNYQPNAIAQSLASKRTGNIGVIIPHEAGFYLSNGYWPMLLSVITKAAATVGYTVLLSTSKVEGDIESAYELMLNGKRIDGIIAGSEMLGEKQLSDLYQMEIPFVMVGKSPYIPDYYVDIDNSQAAFRLTEHMIGCGYRKILFLGGPKKYTNVIERIEGFQKAVSKAGIDRCKVIHTPYEKPSVKSILVEQIGSGYMPEAIIAGAGDLVLCTIMALRELNLDIPDQIGFASFDFLSFFNYLSPRITAIRQPIEELARAAFEMLFALIAGKKVLQKERILTCTLEIGQSCNEILIDGRDKLQN
ncbi:MAG: LacI family DNA-binding transcriptional regulator [Spirochaetales bacterium]|nr:LacI family DNA-binding transcriptional regulator [Spirochaetales bacterium]